MDNFANYDEAPAAPGTFMPDPQPFVQGPVPDEEDLIKAGNFFDAPPAWNDDIGQSEAAGSSFDFEFSDSGQAARASV